jgi:hypothetical protein
MIILCGETEHSCMSSENLPDSIRDFFAMLKYNEKYEKNKKPRLQAELFFLGGRDRMEMLCDQHKADL